MYLYTVILVIIVLFLFLFFSFYSFFFLVLFFLFLFCRGSLISRVTQRTKTDRNTSSPSAGSTRSKPVRPAAGSVGPNAVLHERFSQSAANDEGNRR